MKPQTHQQRRYATEEPAWNSKKTAGDREGGEGG